jgi:hypothetical protein
MPAGLHQPIFSMNHVLSFIQAARAPSAPGLELSSDPMLVELLTLHEEMIAQLRAERPNPFSTAGFLESMIGQHEGAAAMIREKLGHFESKTN